MLLLMILYHLQLSALPCRAPSCSLAVQVCSLLHQRYAEFATQVRDCRGPGSWGSDLGVRLGLVQCVGGLVAIGRSRSMKGLQPRRWVQGTELQRPEPWCEGRGFWVGALVPGILGGRDLGWTGALKNGLCHVRWVEPFALHVAALLPFLLIPDRPRACQGLFHQGLILAHEP